MSRSSTSDRVDVDTIVAVATPPGHGGIGVIRISGPAALRLAETLAGSLPSPRQAGLRCLRGADGTPIDDALVLTFPAPGSYTGEDVVELQAHGGPALMRLLQETLCIHGARTARPGEFTERAFLNGRIDLAQAEAVADLIAAASSQAVRAAHRALCGEFSRKVAAVTLALTALRVRSEADIDFPDEDVELGRDTALQQQLQHTRQQIATLRAQTRDAVVMRDGVDLAIVGAPNVGKSTLMNALSEREAAIVTDIAGTTRDVLRERILINGIVFNLSDSAGLRDSEDRVERIGIQRAREAANAADIVLLLMDDAAPWSATDLEIAGSVRGTVVPVRNKIDMCTGKAGRREGPLGAEFGLSALTGQGLAELRRVLLLSAGIDEPESVGFTARQRHLDALDEAAKAMDRAASLIGDEASLPELVAEELRIAQNALSAITGEFSSDELLGRIFSTFCIGK